MKHPSEEHSVFALELFDNLIEDECTDGFISDFPCISDFTDTYTCHSCTDNKICSLCVEINDDNSTDTSTDIDIVTIANINILAGSSTKSLPSIVQPPTLELKPLPQNLKYSYLGEGDTLPVIISSILEVEQEKQLLEILSTDKKALGWTLADIPGISPSTCMHRILLEDGVKPVRQPQRRLNPVILDVVKKEVTKLLQAEIIYPISDSQW
ncbi:hypothetical protein A2U01_0037124, partial [Trifolium medium]|nr:hypothetical protein [Trifolium medium]